MGKRTPLAELATVDVAAGLAEDTLTFVDTRPNGQVHEGTVAGSLNIPAGKSTASFGAWVVNPETDKNPLVLLAPSQADAQENVGPPGPRRHRQRRGYLTSIEGLPASTPKLIQPEELEASTPPWSWTSGTAPNTPPGTSRARTSSAAAA